MLDYSALMVLLSSLLMTQLPQPQPLRAAPIGTLTTTQ
jgi:hypothetical protein